MSTLAEIVQRYGVDYQEKFADKLLPSHRRALSDIAHCRTAAFGGHLYQCADCGETHYQYHSCQNRHCPQCHRIFTDHGCGSGSFAAGEVMFAPSTRGYSLLAIRHSHCTSVAGAT